MEVFLNQVLKFALLKEISKLPKIACQSCWLFIYFNVQTTE